MAATTRSITEAIIPTAVSLATALFAWCLHNYLRSAVAEFDTEMRAATLDLMNELCRTTP